MVSVGRVCDVAIAQTLELKNPTKIETNSTELSYSEDGENLIVSKQVYNCLNYA